MEQLIDRVKHQFTESIQTHIQVADMIMYTIAEAGEEIVQALLDGKKILTCGNGSSACDAMRFASHLVNRFRDERPGLPAIALTANQATLTAIANDYHYADIFSKPIRALAQEGDVLLLLTASGNSVNLHQALRAAHDKNLRVVALTGGNGGKMSELLRQRDIEIRVHATSNARIHETQLLVLHCLCDLIDFRLFGGE